MNDMYYTYVLYSKKLARLYIGHTNNLERRLKQHNDGKVLSTKPYKPYSLIYFEEYNSKKEAVVREKELKLSGGRRLIKSMMLK